MCSDVKQFLRQLKKEGWTYRHSNSGHIVIEHPEIGRLTMFNTPRCSFWKKHVLSDINKLKKGIYK